MPRRKAKAHATAEAATEAAHEAASNAPATIAPPPANEAVSPRVSAADPQAKLSVSLSDDRGGPSAHLLRSRRYNQMQIRFDGPPPLEPAQALLRDAGWRDRTESEGIWTKQIDRAARWQSVRQMEREFRAVANAIRAAQGLAPARDGRAPA